MLPEIELLSNLIGQVYDAALDPALWTSVLKATAEFVCGPAAALVSHDAGDHSGGFFFSWGDDPYYSKLYFEKYVKLHPVLPQMTLVPVGGVFTIDDLMPVQEFHATRYYKEWVEPQSYCDATSVMLEKSGTALAHLTVVRHRESGPVDEEARRRMALLGPHFRRAVTIGKVIKLQKIQADGLAETLDGLASAVLLVAATGKILFANAAAKRMLDEGTILRGTRDVLTAVDSQAHRSLREIFRATEAGDAAVGAKGITVPIGTADRERWIAHVLPLTSGARRQAEIAHNAAAAVFVRKAELDVPTPAELLIQLYKLTPSELRVLHAIVQVGGIAAAAEMIGISEATVKTHLQHLYEKTGTNRQADLVKLIAAHASPFIP
ncbi:MAG TPA: LuxR C-terminal-related transcriptional regulator [Sphingomicrobium sp.]|nr:LuxR C-terminal-related transcriptional regulator [Sphingomicrobium sp.]